MTRRQNKTPPQAAALVQRLVEIVFAPPEAAIAWLTKIGLTVEPNETKDVLVIHNPALKIRTALVYNSDPITRACCLGFATSGIAWPFLYPGLLEAVNAEWKRRQPVKPVVVVRLFSRMMKHGQPGDTLRVAIHPAEGPAP